MNKKIKLGDVPFGQTFEVWGHAYTALGCDQNGVLVLEADSVRGMQFREDDVEYEVALNDFRDSSVRAYLEGTYTAELVRAGAKLGDDILPMTIDLKCTLGQHEYGTAKVYAGLLTLEQYGEYYEIIPKINTPYWLATPWKTPLRSPYTNYTNYVWLVNSNGGYNNNAADLSYGVRPALVLCSTLLVSVEVDEEAEGEKNGATWQEYIEYLIRWTVEHASDAAVSEGPQCYEKWLNDRGRKDFW